MVHRTKDCRRLGGGGSNSFIVSVLSYRNGSGFIETSPIDTAPVGVNRMQHNFETMQREIESWKVAEA